MGIGGYLLAGALQGAGNAITLKAQQDYTDRRDAAKSELDSRRQIALANLNAENARETTLFNAKVADTADASKQERTNRYAIGLTGVRTEAQKDIDNNRGNIAAENDAASDARDRQTRLMVEGVQHKYRLSEQEAGDLRQFAHDNASVKSIQVLSSGQVVGLTADGTTIAYKGKSADGRTLFLRAAQKGGGEEPSATVGAAMANRGGGSPAPAASASSQPPAPEAPSRGIGTRARAGTPAAGAPVERQQPQGMSADEVFSIGQRVGQPDFSATAATINGGTSYTVAQLREFAEKTGMSDAEARAWARERGYTITR